ncbi:hypothetical protein ACFU5O_24685 [Streptomyces sp. NPDC057445]|uniref:hypothetical protein n=1 Tax=Streptomyces sp. NPDC057445 TaxID=3346136 RepID=UPI003689B9F3
MTAETPSDGGHEAFLRDVALCVSTYRGRTPAMVWPEGEGTALARIGSRPADGGRVEEADELAADLGGLIGLPVSAGLRHLRAWHEEDESLCDRDVLLMPVRGSLNCRIWPCRTEKEPVPDGQDLRLRGGSVLYLPRGARYSTRTGRSAAVLLSFHLGGDG